MGGGNINTVSQLLDLCTTYREAVAEIRFKRCMVFVGGRIRMTVSVIRPLQ